MLQRRKKTKVQMTLETNISELRLLLNKLKCLVWQAENKQIELKNKVSEYESLIKKTENTVKEINKFKVKTKIRKGDE